MEEMLKVPEHEKMQEPVPPLTHVEANQEGYRWVAITAMLFAIGIILHTVSPNVGGVTPNWTIAMYAIVINLTRPPLKRAIGIGFVAGLTLIPSSGTDADPFIQVGVSTGEHCQRAERGYYLLPFGESVCCLPYGRLACYPVYHRLCVHLCIRRRVHVHFEAGAGPAAESMDLCHAACGGGSRRA